MGEGVTLEAVWRSGPIPGVLLRELLSALLPHPIPCPWLGKIKEEQSDGERKKDSQEQYKNKALVLTQIAMATHK